MKNTRFQYEYRKSASKLHQTVGNCLRSSIIFSKQEIYQEYPVNRVNKSYSESSHHFDWVIPKLKIVIECHGKQHYSPVAFDGNYDTAVENFKALKSRDKAKKEAALAAGFSYIEISYTKARKITEETILELVKQAEVELIKYNKEHEEERKVQQVSKEQENRQILEIKRKQTAKEKHEEFLKSEKHKKELKKARSFRQKRYKFLKELKKSG